MSRKLISFSTRWGAQFGGINSFNLDLLSAFAGVAFNSVETVCVVLEATSEQISEAAGAGVRLISLGQNLDNFSAALEPRVWDIVNENIAGLCAADTVWLGHDRITGDIAVAAAQARGGRSALIHHMSYERYEAFAESSSLAKQKEDQQKELFSKANILFGVGPLLRDSLADMFDVENVPMLVPGLPEITTRNAPRTFKVFLSGRLTEDARKVKQAHLGIAAFGDAISQADANPALPDVIRGENEPKLTLRGVDFERTSGGYDPEAELELKLFSERFAGRAFALHALPFTTNRKILFADLAASSLALMPSWHEGFGLVAWEAIGAGVPLIVSKKSGVFRLLKELDHGMLSSLVATVDVLGQSNEPFFLEKDCTNLSQAIIQIAKDPTAFRKKASQLREALAERFTWANCARHMAEVLCWRIDDIPSVVQVLTHSTVPVAVDAGPTELPQAAWELNRGLSDSQLLRAEEAIIPFDEKRIPFMEEQLAWARDHEFPISIRLLTGPGGIGKTRLAIEMCKSLKALGWNVGFLRGDCDVRKAEGFSRSIQNQMSPWLVVIDYAETRQSILLSLLKGLVSASNEAHIRVLLLARSGGEWWDLLPSKEPACEALLAGMASSGPFDVPILHGDQYERQKAYQVALQAFAVLLQVSPPKHEPYLVEAHFSHPLYLQMAALMALRGERPQSAEALTRALVGHERRYWRKALSLPSVDAEHVEEQAALLMAIATLSGGLVTFKESQKIWESAGGERELLKALFFGLSPLYPARQGLDGWRPDILGEALIAQILLTHLGPKMLNAVLGHADRHVRKSTLTVLARMLRHRADIVPIIEDSLTLNFHNCVDEIVATSIETPSILPHIAEVAFKRLEKPVQWQVAGMLSKHIQADILPLSGLDVLVSKVAVEKVEKSKRQNSVETKIEYGRALERLAVALDRDGQQDYAVVVARKTIEIRQELTLLDAARCEGDLASSLNIYADLLATIGKLDLAFSISMRALKIKERFATERPELFEADLANSLAQHSRILLKQGKFDEALDASEKALSITKRLAEKSRAKNSNDLGYAYGNYASVLSSLGRIEDALVATENAVQIFQQLSHEKPEQFEDNLAVSLNNYANLLSEQGRSDEALGKCEQALSINRRLASTKPKRFEHVLANSLSNYAAHLSERGKFEEAALLAWEALDLRKKLTLANPVRFEDQLSQSLHNYANHLGDLGRFEESVKYDEEALPLLRRLALEQPSRYAADLATLLDSYAYHLSALGKWNDAIRGQQESAAIFAEVAERIPRRYLVRLENVRIQTALWEWIENESSDFTLSINLGASLINSRDIKALEFQYLATRAIIQKKPEDFIGFISKWQMLDPIQKNFWNELYLVAAALSSITLGKANAPRNWEQQVASMAHQLKGRFPKWMSEAVARAGGSL